MTFTHVTTFHSLAEMIDFASRPSEMSDNRRSSRGGDGRGFYMTDSFEDAVALATKGYTEVESKAKALATQIESKVRKVMAEEVTLDYDETGTILDLDAYLSGEANCVMQPVVHHQVATAPTCRILVNCAFAGATNASFYVEQGAVVIALCDLLRQAGYATEVWACSTNMSGSRKNTFACRVKSFDDFGSVSSMLFGLAHPSFQRRLVWSCRETMDADFRRSFDVGGNYGQATQPEIPGEEFDITIGNGTHGLTRDPISYILQTLRGLGVEIVED